MYSREAAGQAHSKPSTIKLVPGMRFQKGTGPGRGARVAADPRARDHRPPVVPPRRLPEAPFPAPALLLLTGCCIRGRFAGGWAAPAPAEGGGDPRMPAHARRAASPDPATPCARFGAAASVLPAPLASKNTGSSSVVLTSVASLSLETLSRPRFARRCVCVRLSSEEEELHSSSEPPPSPLRLL